MKAIPPLTVTVLGFCDITGLGRTTAFKLAKEGQIERIRAGGRSLLTYASVEAYIERARIAGESSKQERLK